MPNLELKSSSALKEAVKNESKKIFALTFRRLDEPLSSSILPQYDREPADRAETTLRFQALTDHSD